MKKIELLAPAGDEEALKTAIEAAIAQIQPGEVAVDKAALRELLPLHILLLEPFPLEALALDHPQPLL